MTDQEVGGNKGLESVSNPVEDEATTLPAIVPEDGEAPSSRPRPKWLVPVIVAVIVVMVVVAGLVGWSLAENRRHDAALESCNRTVKTLQNRTGSAKMDSYREASSIKADQVKDASTVQAMTHSVKAVGGLKRPAFQCKASMSADELNAKASKAKKFGDEYAAVSKSAKAVMASRDAKTIEDAKVALNAKKDEAAKLLGDCDGKVANSAVRDSLQKVIDQAGQIKVDTAKAYRDAVNALQAAIDQVNASMQAKSQADQQAAAVQQAVSSDNGSRSGYTPFRPATGQPGGAGGSDRFAQDPAGSSTAQGGKSSWRDRLKGNTTGGNGCNPDGSCGIG